MKNNNDNDDNKIISLFQDLGREKKKMHKYKVKSSCLGLFALFWKPLNIYYTKINKLIISISIKRREQTN